MTTVVEPIFRADAAQTDLATAIQLMSGLSRNRFLVRALDAREQPLGEIEVKGGMVLRAQVGDITGREAVFALLNLRPQTLSAFHVQGGELAEPVGSLERLLMEGAVVIDELSRAIDGVAVSSPPALEVPEFVAPQPAPAPPAPVAPVAPVVPQPAVEPAQPSLKLALALSGLALLFVLLARRRR